MNIRKDWFFEEEDQAPPPVATRRNLHTEGVKRDAALDLLKAARAELISAATKIAHLICATTGRVTSVEVLAEMEKDPRYAQRLKEVDPRWIGAVFRSGWTQVGQEAKGSHKRKVAIWTVEK